MPEKIEIAWLSPGADSSSSRAAYLGSLLEQALRQSANFHFFSESTAQEFIKAAECNRFAFHIFPWEDSPELEFSRKLSLEFPGHLAIIDTLFHKSEAGQSVKGREALVLNQRNIAEFSRQYPGNNLRYLPYPVSITSERTEKHGVALCGGVGLEFRAELVLAALAERSYAERISWFLPRNQFEQAKENLADFPKLNCALIADAGPLAWRELVSTHQLAVHLLISAYGDTEPQVLISMEAGVPVLLSDFSGASVFGPELSSLIPPGLEEASAITAFLSNFESAEELKRKSRKAREYVHELHAEAFVGFEFLSWLEAISRPGGSALYTT